MSNEQALREALQQLHDVMRESMGTGGWVPTPLHSSFMHAMIDAKEALALPPAAPRDEREAFEAWMLKEGNGPTPRIWKECSRFEGEYADEYWHTSWKTWQAARATLPPATLPLLSDDEMPPLPEPAAWRTPWPTCYEYTHEEPDSQRVEWAARYGRKHEQVFTADQLRARDRAVEAAVRKQMGVV